VSRPGYWADPSVSPDGRTVAFAGADPATNHRTSDLYTIEIDGSGMRDLSRPLDRDPGDLTWAPDGKAIYFTAPDRGAINVHVADLAGGVRDVTQGAQVVSLASCAQPHGRSGSRAIRPIPPTWLRLDLRKPQGVARLTHVNDDVLGDKRLARTEEVWFGSSVARGSRAGSSPRRHSPREEISLLLEIHGGPFAMYNVGFSYMFQTSRRTATWCCSSTRGAAPATGPLLQRDRS